MKNEAADYKLPGVQQPTPIDSEKHKYLFKIATMIYNFHRLHLQELVG